MGFIDNINKMLHEELGDHESQRLYINIALERFHDQRDTQAFLNALHHVAQVQGMKEVAGRMELSAEELAELFFNTQEPGLPTLCRIMNALGFHLSAVSR